MKKHTLLAAGMAVIILCACGDKAPQQPGKGAQLAESSSETMQATAQPELGGRFEVSGNETWNVAAPAAQLTCQGSFGGSPFRAQWFDTQSKTGVLVTGRPLDDGSHGTRVDNFQLTSLAGTNQTNARLSGASLTVRKLSSQGAVGIYEVSATGTIIEGGSFEASGICRA